MNLLERYVFVLEQIYAHSAFQSDCSQHMVQKIDAIAKQVGEPNGKVTFSAQVPADKRELQKVFRDKRLLKAESVTLEMQFAQNLFMGVDPKINKKVEELLADAPLEYLKNTMEAFSRVNDMVETMSENIKEVAEKRENVVALLDINLDNLIRGGIERSRLALKKEVKEVRKVKAEVREGLVAIEEAIERTKSLQSKARNVVKSKSPVVRSVKMRKP